MTDTTTHKEMNMTTTLKTPTLSEFKAWAKENHKLAHAVCMAQAYAETMRARVDAYIEPIFTRYAFKADAEIMKGHVEYGKPLTKSSDLYLSDDPRLTDYYEECDQAHRAHGFKGPKGHCPALTAENLLIQAQNALLESGEELTGIEPSMLYGDKRAKMLDLLLGACLKKD